jgi:hypothetical protein
MRFRVFLGSIAALVLLSTSAFAQKRGGGGGGGTVTKGTGNNTPSGQITYEHPTGTLAALARSRAAAGDCKAALEAFDAALENSVDPELHRDRGICHEKLGDPFPAMDDYRYYLTYRPDAKDADSIHDRLDALMVENGQAQAEPTPDKSSNKTGDDKSSQKSDKKHDPEDPSTPTAEDVHSDESASVSLGNAGTDTGKSVDAIDSDEKLESEADASSLRRGTGFVIGPYFALRDFTKAGYGGGEAVGCAFRYSLGAPSSLVTELGYSTINSTGSDSSLGGLMVFGGYEARVGLDPRYTNAILFQAGLGYERLSQGGTGLVASMILPRGRFGFRHIFGPSIGLELGADAGYGFVSILGESGASTSSLMIGGSVALLVGF